MDLPIKKEPGIYEDTTQSPEFLEEKPNEIYIVNAAETNVMNSYQHPKIVVDKANELNVHSRKALLKAFQQEGCTLETIEKYSLKHNYNVDMATEYFNKAAKDAQKFVYQESDSLSFNNITEWLKYFETTGRAEQCNYEAAIVVNAIANNEYHPEPKLMGCINLKAIYKFLSNALMGLPQEQLDDTSAKFLSNEFQNLIDEANTEKADNDVRSMKSKIEESLLHPVNGKSYELDPLNTNTEELKQCYINIKNEENLK